MPVPDHDLDRLRAARPELDDAVASPSTHAARALAEAIVTADSNDSVSAPTRLVPNGASRHGRHRIAAFVATAAAIALVVGIVASGGRSGGDRVDVSASSAHATDRPIALVNVRTIAARSNTALAGSGRAEITFKGGEGVESGATDLSFSGHNVSMVIHFNGENGESGFDATNKTIDGQFYLYTPGPDGVSRWYHDTSSTASSVFDTDPRTLLAALVPEAGFVDVGRGAVDGVAVTHLRATRLGSLPALDLSLGPIDAGDIHTLDLWVDGDDVVRQLDLTTEHNEQVLDPKTGPKLQKSTDGTITVIDANGRTQTVQQGENLNAILKDFPHVTRTYRSSYSARFFDIGQPITITAPADATAFAGKG